MDEPTSPGIPIKHNDGITYEGWKDPIDTSFFKGLDNISTLPGYVVQRPEPFQPATMCNCDENFEVKDGTTLDEIIEHVELEQKKNPHQYNLYNIFMGKVKFANPEPFWELF